MSKSYYSLGLMSGTSMDGVDASIIQSDGEIKFKVILDKYFEYPKGIYKKLTKLRDKIESSKDLKKFSKEVINVEKEITLFHAKAANDIIKKTKVNIDFIGFHGQTIYHNARKKISKQLGDGKLLSKITKKTVVFDFRQNDLKNNGHGAPLTPAFHKILAKKINIKNVTFVNIGGIINATTILDDGNFHACDIGPGMCLIDKWIRINSKKKYDHKGKIASTGKINNNIFNIATKKYIKEDRKKIKSLDVKDCELYFNFLNPAFRRSLSLKNGAATLIEFTAMTLRWGLVATIGHLIKSNHKFILCGGGRKNDFLLQRINKYLPGLKVIDDFDINGDFIESQAFAYLAIRSYLKLPISFPETTGVKKPCTGGKIIKN